MSIRILLAEDHDLFRAGLRALFSDKDGFVVVGEASSGCQAVELAASLRPDVTLMDLSMPEMNGVEAIQQIASRRWASGLIALSSHTAEKWVIRALRAGARGYVLKTERPEGLRAAVQEVHRGGTWFSQQIAVILARLSMEPRFAHTEPLARLSRRQRLVLQLVAEGHTNRDIALRLQISESTVDSHRTELMRRLGVHEVAGLVRFACREGLVNND
jgi:DNA-binding NarL/FixJ family response regulator